MADVAALATASGATRIGHDLQGLLDRADAGWLLVEELLAYCAAGTVPPVADRVRDRRRAASNRAAIAKARADLAAFIADAVAAAATVGGGALPTCDVDRRSSSIPVAPDRSPNAETNR